MKLCIVIVVLTTMSVFPSSWCKAVTPFDPCEGGRFPGKLARFKAAILITLSYRITGNSTMHYTLWM